MSTEKKPAGKSDKMSRIDALIAQAKADKAKRAPGEKAPKQPKPAKQADPEKEAAKAAKQAEREAKKAETQAAREAKRAERTAATAERRAAKQAEREAKKAAKPPAHLAKLQKAEAKLPALTPAAMAFVATSGGLSAAELTAAAEHIAFRARSLQTQAALTVKLEEGDAVRITTGKHAGRVGTLEKVARIHCFVQVEGLDKSLYLFTSDVEKVEQTVPADAEPDFTAGVAEAVG